MHKLHIISQSKGNQTMNLGQLVDSDKQYFSSKITWYLKDYLELSIAQFMDINELKMELIWRQSDTNS